MATSIPFSSHFNDETTDSNDDGDDDDEDGDEDGDGEDDEEDTRTFHRLEPLDMNLHRERNSDGRRPLWGDGDGDDDDRDDLRESAMVSF